MKNNRMGIKPGDNLWHITKGWLTVTKISYEDVYPLERK